MILCFLVIVLCMSASGMNEQNTEKIDERKVADVIESNESPILETIDYLRLSNVDWNRLTEEEKERVLWIHFCKCPFGDE